MSDIQLRLLTADDLEMILHHRRAMFTDMGVGTEAQRDEMTVRSREWLRDYLPKGLYTGFMAVNEQGEVVGGAGVWLQDWMAAPLTLNRQRGYIMNVYVEPEYRRQGLASRLTSACVDECRRRGITMIYLHYSNEGRLVYEKLGFTMGREMRYEV
jgi:GNAT superfamily N-acetyltransferase